jgi:hypothetical protein
MTPVLIHGDHVSCSRVGGSMRRESSRLRQHALSLEDALRELVGWTGADAESGQVAAAAAARALKAAGAAAQALKAAADDLDEAGAALQGYATDLAEGHELGRLAELRVHEAGLFLEGTRVVEPWGPASAEDAERRQTQVPLVQARVDLATGCVGRARSRLRREMRRLELDFAERSDAVDQARPTPPRPR